MAETTVVILGRQRRKGDKANSSVIPFPIKYWPISQKEWRYQPNKPSATASKCRWNSDAASEHMGRSGEEKDVLHNKTKPKTKSTHWTAKERHRNTSLYSSVSTPEKPKHSQQQSKLQAALGNTKEQADTTFYLLTAKTFNLLIWQTSQATRAALSKFTARLKAKTLSFFSLEKKKKVFKTCLPLSIAL